MGKYRSLGAEKSLKSTQNGLFETTNDKPLKPGYPVPPYISTPGCPGFFQVNFNISAKGFTFAVLKKQKMANHSATKKDVRQANKRRDRNRYYGKTTRNAIRDLKATSDAKVYGEQLPEVISQIDKLAKRGIIHKNKAANLKSKLSRKTASA